MVRSVHSVMPDSSTQMAAILSYPDFYCFSRNGMPISRNIEVRLRHVQYVAVGLLTVNYQSSMKALS